MGLESGDLWGNAWGGGREEGGERPIFHFLELENEGKIRMFRKNIPPPHKSICFFPPPRIVWIDGPFFVSFYFYFSAFEAFLAANSHCIVLYVYVLLLWKKWPNIPKGNENPIVD